MQCVAVAIYTGLSRRFDNLNKASIDRGMFHVVTYKTIIVEERKIGVNEKICMPVASVRRMNNYSLLEDNPESPYLEL